MKYLKFKLPPFQIIICSLIAFFAIINLLTIKLTPLPWVDEVMSTDFALNIVQGNGVTSTVMTNIFLKLHQFLLIPWIRVFDFSLVGVRSFNVFFAFILCVILTFILFRNKKNYLSIIFFILLFWSAGVFSWIYRCGRIDLISILGAVCFIIVAYKYLFTSKVKRIWLFFAAILVELSGIPVIPFILFGLLWFLLFNSDLKGKLFTIILWFILGVIVGFLIDLAILVLFGDPLGYIVSIIGYSQSAYSIYVKVISNSPFLADWFGFDQYKFANYIANNIASVEKRDSLFDNIYNGYILNPEYLIVTMLNIVVGSYLLIKKKVKLISNEIYIISFSLLIPFIMALSGRYPIYYTWMGYLTAIMAVIWLHKKYKSPIFTSALVLVTIYILSSGLVKTLLTSDENKFNNVVSFVKKQSLDSDDVIISSFVTYYPVRQSTVHCYTSTYPIIDSILMKEVDYIFVSNDYEYQKIYDFMDSVQIHGRDVVLVDSIINPVVKMYKVDN